MIYTITFNTENKEVQVTKGNESPFKITNPDCKDPLTEQMIKAQAIIENDMFMKTIVVDNTEFKKRFEGKIKEITHEVKE